MAGGSLRLEAAELGDDGVPPAKGPPVNAPPGCWVVNPPAGFFEGGAPCRDSENAFIFACISEFNPLARCGSGPGRLAAFVGPSGAEEGLIVDAMLALCVFSDGGWGGDCGAGLV